ncbi:SRPBCC domain-containing protein [Salinimicrobium oceani]|uniref:ATPase n=1 Tax=Salinimicrobium oceani TaxID=2722702 RepID=A0ABX1CZC5_9FLAO|nr:SRPBCC domain-containing protein [Salinimicrobium oceani]NJW53616.1 ATPase [Salinimicrobium oceani]
MEKLQIHTALQIARSRNDIFEAIVNPEKMSNYFIARGSGRMEEGNVVTWSFPEFPDSFPVKVKKVTAFEKVIFEWEGQEGSNLQVEISLEDRGNDHTLVRVTEGEMEADAKGIKWLAQNTEGWANFLACLKAYMEYDINLRKGGFDFMKK